MSNTAVKDVTKEQKEEGNSNSSRFRVRINELIRHLLSTYYDPNTMLCSGVHQRNEML